MSSIKFILNSFYLYSRWESFVDIFGAITRCHNQIVSTLCLAIEGSFCVDGSIRHNFKVIITCGYAVLDATVIACERKTKWVNEIIQFYGKNSFLGEKNKPQMNCGDESVVIDFFFFKFCELMTSLAKFLSVNLTSLFSIMICLIFLNCCFRNWRNVINQNEKSRDKNVLRDELWFSSDRFWTR